MDRRIDLVGDLSHRPVAKGHVERVEVGTAEAAECNDLLRILLRRVIGLSGIRDRRAAQPSGQTSPGAESRSTTVITHRHRLRYCSPRTPFGYHRRAWEFKNRSFPYSF